ncbi:MAG: AAA family ATPase [Myxococcaceae bacterium]|nr:AAA family ATPase [Myxococcaceae bacterium]
MSDPAPAASDTTPRFIRDLETMVRARYPLVYLVTHEEQRIDAVVAEVAERHGKQLWEWSITQGLRMAKTRAPSAEDTSNPVTALQSIASLKDANLVVLKDFHRYLDDASVVRALRELGHSLKVGLTTVLLVSPTLTIPPELEKDVSVIDVPLPTVGELLQLLKDIFGILKKSNRSEVHLTRDDAEALVKAAHGLTLSEAENAFAKAIALDNRLDVADVRVILEEKRQVVRKSGLLEYFPSDESLSAVGGLEQLKVWLDRRKNAFGAAARDFGLPEPKGLLLLGVQGCGKSLTAKAISAQWRLPLLRLDMGRIFSGLIGSSEENVRKAIKSAEGLAPVVLWVDEIEKGLAGSGGGANDTGVAARVFGTLLTWLQEKTAPVFVVATANRIDALPPELLRKGRFDEIFFIDLPTANERADIFRIHLAKRRRAPESFDVAKLAAAAEGFSGAEIEQAIVSALYDAFADGAQLSQAGIEKSLAETVPLSRTMVEEIARLRDWAKLRTRKASA